MIPRSARLGPLEPIFNPDMSFGSIAVGGTPGAAPVTVTINQATGQTDPTSVSPIEFDVTFSEAVTGLTGADVTLSGTATPSVAWVADSGDHTNFTVYVTGMAGPGTVIASIPGGVTNSVADGVPNSPSTSTDNTVTYTGNVTVTINVGVGQPDPTYFGPVIFDVAFGAPVTGFTTGDVTLSGTAGASVQSVIDSGDNQHFTVQVSGMTDQGTVIADIAAGVCTSGGNPNEASTSFDNVIDYVCNDTDDPFEDDFNRPNRTFLVDSLGACWDQSQPTTGGTILFWGLDSSEMRYVGASSTSRQSRRASPRLGFGGPDFVMEIDVEQLAGIFLGLNVYLRGSDLTFADSYAFNVQNGGFGGVNLELSIAKIVGGSATSLATTSIAGAGSGGGSPLVPECLIFSAVGSTLDISSRPIGGGSVTSRLSASNSDVTSGDLVAIHASSNSNNNPIRLSRVSVTS